MLVWCVLCFVCRCNTFPYVFRYSAFSLYTIVMYIVMYIPWCLPLCSCLPCQWRAVWAVRDSHIVSETPLLWLDFRGFCDVLGNSEIIPQIRWRLLPLSLFAVRLFTTIWSYIVLVLKQWHCGSINLELDTPNVHVCYVDILWSFIDCRPGRIILK